MVSSPVRTLALLAALLSLSLSLGSIARNRPLASLGGLSDEWFALGTNLVVYGTLGVGTEPIVFRPPGYPAFIAGALRMVLGPSARPGVRLPVAAAVAVYVSQCVVLAATSALLCVWLSRRLRPLTAFLGAVLFGVNPYTIILTSFLHYDIVHLFLLIAGGLALEAAVAARGRPTMMVAVGALWGVATLVRPLTLMLPPFVWAACWLRDRRAPLRALSSAVAFTLGLLLVVAPWTARNWRLTHRVIPVNAQFWTVTWATTVMKTGMEPDHYKWYAIARAHYLPIYSRVTGESDYHYITFVRDIVLLEDAFRVETLRNIRRQPGVYAHNAALSFVSLNVQVNAILLTVFRRLQEGAAFQPEWLSAGTLARGPEARALGALVGALTALAGGAIVVGARSRDGFLAVPLTLHLALSALHAMTYMDTFYYYVKLPVLVLLAFYVVDRFPAPFPAVLGTVLTGSTLLMSLSLLFA